MPSTATDSQGPRQAGDKVRHELEKLVESVWSRSERALDAMGLAGLVGQELQPRLDVTETETAVEVVANIPGIDPDSINISLAGNMLTLSGAYPEREETGHAVAHRRERPTGEFCRSLPLPCSVNADAITATAKHGVLEITLNKPDSEKVHQVHIRVKSRESADETGHDQN